MRVVRRPATQLLSVLLLGLVAFGLLLKPMQVLACDLGDLAAAAGVSVQVQADAPDGARGDECCPAADCGECCVPAAAISTIARVTSNIAHAHVGTASRSSAFHSADSPVDIRPPIAS